MDYRFERQDKSYEDYASGRVLYNQPGATAFPVRLASEIFQRCREHLRKRGIDGRLSLYDPCCGGAYMLTSMGFLHGESLASLLASDVNTGAVQLAAKNLTLLTPDGLASRIDQLKQLLGDYGKPSHHEALQSAYRLKEILDQRSLAIATRCFLADALQLGSSWPYDTSVDLVMTDLPYGHLVHWADASADPIGRLLDNLAAALKPHGLAAIIADKKQVLRHERYRRVERFQVGKRQVAIMELQNA